MDTPMFSQIERGDHPAMREQVVLIAKLLNKDEKELLTDSVIRYFHSLRIKKN
jgi:hypothetical protein